MSKIETEHEVAYEWLRDPQTVTALELLKDWKKTEQTYRIKDTIYDSSDKEMSKHKVGVRLRSKNDTTVLTAKRYVGQGESGESIFDEFHKDIASGERPAAISSAEFDLNVPEVELNPYLEFTNRRIEVVYERGNEKVLVINEVVTYSDSVRVCTEKLLEIEFINTSDALISDIRKELESTYSLKMYKEGKTDRAVRLLSQLKETPLVENLNDVEALEMSAHGGKGLMRMKFFHQPYNAFSSPEVDAKVIGYDRSNWPWNPF